MTRQDKPAYPGAVAIRRAVQAARTSGITVGSVEISPCGTLRIHAVEAAFSRQPSEFDSLNAAGLL
jgi:hypothetical protein